VPTSRSGTAATTVNREIQSTLTSCPQGTSTKRRHQFPKTYIDRDSNPVREQSRFFRTPGLRNWEALMLPLHHRCLQNRRHENVVTPWVYNPRSTLYSSTLSFSCILYSGGLARQSLGGLLLHQLQKVLCNVWTTFNLPLEQRMRAVEVDFNCSLQFNH
jgi:hypothetical protein